MTSLETLRGKRVLVTGAAGFMGMALTRRLVQMGAKVHGLISPRGSLTAAKNNIPGCQFSQGDMTDIKFCQSVVRDTRPHIIYHFASYGNHPEHYASYRPNSSPQDELVKIAHVNVTGMVNLLSALKEIDFECLINTGSPAEYGPKNQPLREDQLLAPDTLYGASKASATLLGQSFGKLHHKTVITLRPSYVYGPGERLTRLIPTMIQTCLDDGELRLTSSQEKKDFIFIEDVIHAYLLCPLLRRLTGTFVINIGASIETSFAQLIHLIEKILKKKLRFVDGVYDSIQWQSDCWAMEILQAEEKLGWKPETDLVSGLAKEIEWIRTIRTNPRVFSST